MITKEYPRDYDGMNEPFYPIGTAAARSLASEYIERAQADGYLIGGRLAGYRYLDIDDAICEALQLTDALLGDSPPCPAPRP